MQTLITGATGFIGSAVARRFLDAGHDVRVLVRESSNRENIQDLEVEETVGDLRDRESLMRAVSGCDLVVHTAADYRFWVPDPEPMYDINVEGTRRLMEASLEERVERVVYTSSVATLNIRPEGPPADETDRAEVKKMIGHYKRSKCQAERVVENLISEDGLPAVIVLPSAPAGPRDLRPTPTGRMIKDAANGNMPFYVETGLNIVHVDDVAKGHLLAFRNGKVGRRYILGGENVWLREILDKTAEMSGSTGPYGRIPKLPLYPVAYMSEAWAWMTGQTPRLTRSSLQMSGRRMFFTSERAKEELEYDPRPADEALRDAVAWFTERCNS